jgi:hypothetical protein
MINADLAILFDIPTKVLKKAVKRNIDRFPEDFVFELTGDEKFEVVTNCDHFQENLRRSRKYTMNSLE